MDKNQKHHEYFELFGEAILLASMQFAIGSVEMSSKFSVKNFSKDQETLQNAADALCDYLKIGVIWMIGVSILLQANYGIAGAVSAIICNLIIVIWVYTSYLQSFKIATEKYNLVMPKIF